ncbi:MAG: hypothetical protein AB7P14_19570 [Blastocatellales bacterium]
MALQTRQNPETGILEVLIDDRWIKFEDYRKLQIEDAYQSSVKFLRERLGEDAAKQVASRVSDDAND